MVKILAVGNSFSDDATAYLKKFADADGIDVKVVNLYIGGCSLKTHSHNIKNDLSLYRLGINGESTNRLISVKDAIAMDAWDIVTMQQVSGESLYIDSYNEYGEFVANYLRKSLPKARLWFHKTWAYEVDYTFLREKGLSQADMHNMITSAVKEFCEKNGDIPIIPAGDAIARLREYKEFNTLMGGESLCRDGFHLSLTYGRYAAASVWYKTLLNGDVINNSYVPMGGDTAYGLKIPNEFKTDTEKLNLIKKIVAEL